MKLPYFLVQPVITLPLLAAGAFALHAPTEWASSEYLPHSLLRFMSFVFPPITAYAQKPQLPAIPQLYMAVTFMLIPLHVWYRYKSPSRPSDEPWFKKLWNIDSRWVLAKRVSLVISIGVILYFSLFINPGYDFNLLPLNSSRIALGFGRGLEAGGAQGHLIAWIFCNLLVFAEFLGRK